jgi:hypothetical protein
MNALGRRSNRSQAATSIPGHQAATAALLAKASYLLELLLESGTLRGFLREHLLVFLLLLLFKGLLIRDSLSRRLMEVSLQEADIRFDHRFEMRKMSVSSIKPGYATANR